MFNIFTKNTGFLHKKQDVSRESEAGNVIIWIFLMIAIFAALNFAVSRGSRSGGAQLTQEQARIAATEILDYARNMRDAVRSLQIDGCNDTEISFENNTVSGYEHTPPARDECKVFHPSGGGMNYITPDENWIAADLPALAVSADHYQTWHITGKGFVTGVGTGPLGGSNCGDGTNDCKELISGVPFIKREICLEINRKLGWTTGDPAIPIYQDVGSSFGFYSNASGPFDGNYISGYNMGSAFPAHYRDILVGCIEGNPTAGSGTPTAGVYSFFQVLIAR